MCSVFSLFYREDKLTKLEARQSGNEQTRAAASQSKTVRDRPTYRGIQRTNGNAADFWSLRFERNGIFLRIFFGNNRIWERHNGNTAPEQRQRNGGNEAEECTGRVWSIWAVAIAEKVKISYKERIPNAGVDSIKENEKETTAFLPARLLLLLLLLLLLIIKSYTEYNKAKQRAKKTKLLHSCQVIYNAAKFISQ